MTGIVYLVGAGPGDPSLLTLRARELLESCDVVAYDELCSDALLAGVPPTALLVPVGRRAYDGPRERMHPAVLEHARAGKRVVRLKAGDPFVFGRGGEEAEELRAAGVPFEVVPGVSSALGAAAYAGIPLTHRGVASAVTLATGHEGMAGPIPRGTIVLFMAARRLAENLQRLVDGGRDAATPAAYVAAATTARQQVIEGTVADLAARVAESAIDREAPALIFVGEVVALRSRVDWRASRRRVLVGRARPGRSQIAARLAALGVEVIEAPEISVAPPSRPELLDRALVELGGYGAIVFASAEAATHALARLGALGRDVRMLASIPFVAVGAAAAAALRERGIVAIEVEGACRDALAALPRTRLLVVADEGGRPQLADDLRALEISFDVVAAYRHVLRWPPLRTTAFDLVIAPSSSAALHLGEGPYGEALRAQRWLAMGPKSAAAARQIGATDLSTAERDDVDAIVARAQELLS
jgi:uroporphyrinogen III methyltransferase / synthase